MTFKLCKDIWTVSTVDGFKNIELEERPQDEVEVQKTIQQVP